MSFFSQLNPNKRLLWLACLGCGLLSSGLANGQEFVVIVSSQSPIQQLTADELTEIFMDRNMGSGKKYDLYAIDHSNMQLKERFYEQVAHSSLNSVHAYWSKRVFSGRGRPPASLHNEAILQAFFEHPNAIAYVEDKSRLENTKVVYRSRSTQ